MIKQSISHLMVKISLLYVIRNRSYSHLKNIPEREHCRFWVKGKRNISRHKRYIIYMSRNGAVFGQYSDRTISDGGSVTSLSKKIKSSFMLLNHFNFDCICSVF